MRGQRKERKREKERREKREERREKRGRRGETLTIRVGDLARLHHYLPIPSSKFLHLLQVPKGREREEREGREGEEVKYLI